MGEPKLYPEWPPAMGWRLVRPAKGRKSHTMPAAFGLIHFFPSQKPEPICGAKFTGCTAAFFMSPRILPRTVEPHLCPDCLKATLETEFDSLPTGICSVA